MIVNPKKNQDWTRQGNLMSAITFRWVGEIVEATLKQTSRMVIDSTLAESTTYSIQLRDGYGFEFSYKPRQMGLKRGHAVTKVLQTGMTIIVEGDVCIRRGKTYFNAKKLLYPDGSDIVIPWGEPKEDEKNGEDTTEDRIN